MQKMAKKCKMSKNVLQVFDPKISLVNSTNGPSAEMKGVTTPQTEEDRWAHFNEFVFIRP